jgi:hypothetical protein
LPTIVRPRGTERRVAKPSGLSGIALAGMGCGGSRARGQCRDLVVQLVQRCGVGYTSSVAFSTTGRLTMDRYQPLAVQAPRAAALSLAKAESHADLNDPAAVVFTDLRVAPGVVVPATEPLAETRRLMQLAGVRMAFVVDVAERVIGMVVLADLQGERPTLEARMRSVALRDLSVTEVMTRVAECSAVDMGHIARARIGHVVATFQATGQRYLIVTEQHRDETGAAHTVIRGLFSANRVERALGHPIEVELRSRNFAEMTAALANS